MRAKHLTLSMITAGLLVGALLAPAAALAHGRGNPDYERYGRREHVDHYRHHHRHAEHHGYPHKHHERRYAHGDWGDRWHHRHWRRHHYAHHYEPRRSDYSWWW